MYVMSANRVINLRLGKNDMKIFMKFLIVISLTVLQSADCFAKAGRVVFKTDFPSCIAVRNYDGRHNKFWYCNYQDLHDNGEKCEDKTGIPYKQGYTHIKQSSTTQSVIFSTDAEGAAAAEISDVSYSKDRQYFVCCPGGWKEVTSIHKEHPTWGLVRAEENKPKSKDVPGGTCNQQVYTTVCGDEVLVTDCTEPDDCTDGYISRKTSSGTKKCVLPCADGMAFSAGSDQCVECPITTTSGPVNNECKTCNTTELYDPETSSCKSKTAYYTAIANFAYEKCWLCPDPSNLKTCLLGFTADPSYTAPDACTLSGSGN